MPRQGPFAASSEVRPSSSNSTSSESIINVTEDQDGWRRPRCLLGATFAGSGASLSTLDNASTENPSLANDDRLPWNFPSAG